MTVSNIAQAGRVMKTCGLCKRELPSGSFSLDKSMPDLLQKNCRNCKRNAIIRQKKLLERLDGHTVITAKKAQELANISVETCYRICADGAVLAVDVGQEKQMHWRISRESLGDWAAKWKPKSPIAQERSGGGKVEDPIEALKEVASDLAQSPAAQVRIRVPAVVPRDRLLMIEGKLRGIASGLMQNQREAVIQVADELADVRQHVGGIGSLGGMY